MLPTRVSALLVFSLCLGFILIHSAALVVQAAVAFDEPGAPPHTAQPFSMQRVKRYVETLHDSARPILEKRTDPCRKRNETNAPSYNQSLEFRTARLLDLESTIEIMAGRLQDLKEHRAANSSLSYVLLDIDYEKKNIEEERRWIARLINDRLTDFKKDITESKNWLTAHQKLPHEERAKEEVKLKILLLRSNKHKALLAQLQSNEPVVDYGFLTDCELSYAREQHANLDWKTNKVIPEFKKKPTPLEKMKSYFEDKLNPDKPPSPPQKGGNKTDLIVDFVNFFMPSHRQAHLPPEPPKG